MLSLSRALLAGALLAASASAGDHFILTQVRSLEYSRVDPLVTAGKNGPHVHHILGGSAFGPNTGSPDSLEQSQCSSSLVGDDKSAYWTPLLYYKHANGTYSPMTGQTRIYYFLKPGNGTTPVKAFPRGHRMLAGPPSDTRPQEYPPKGSLSYDQLQAMDPRLAALKWGCGAGPAGGSMDGQSPWLPNHAPDGCGIVTAGIFYPSCSDGRLDSDDHFSHMRYPLDGSNGFNCPPSHPIKYPTMFLEHFYFPREDQPYRGANQDNWVLSNGDTTGMTMHADFINGWTPGVLEDTMAQCNTPNAPETELQNCAPLAKTLNVENANKCRSQGDIVDEDVGLRGSISALPGCNPIWPLDARTKPSCKTDELPMTQPVGRVEFLGLAIALPYANGGGSAKTVVASTTGAASTSSSASVASAAATTSAAASVSSTSAAASSTGYADPYQYGVPAGSSSSSASAAASTSDAYGAPPAGSTSSSTSTASSDPYAYGAPAGTSATASASDAYGAPAAGSTSSSTSAASTSTGHSDPYAYGAPAGGSSSSGSATAPGSDPYTYSAPAAGSSSSVASVAAAAATPSTSASSAYVAPGSAPGTTSAVYVAPAGAKPTGTKSASTNPAVSSASSSANAAPTPQRANAAPKPNKTCAHRKHKNHGSGHHRREMRKRMIK